MIHKHPYSCEQFNLRDCRWEVQSVQDGEMTIRVDGENILTGECQGEVIEQALVTFRGFSMTWFRIFKEAGDGILMEEEQAREILMDGDYFVFSFWDDGQECECAGLGGETFAMLFSYDSAEITWDAFRQHPVGELVTK